MSSGPESPGGRRSVRTKTLELTPRADGTFDFTTSLVDRSHHGRYEVQTDSMTIHDFELRGAIDADLVLTELAVVAREHPFPQCPIVTAAVPGLVGSTVAAGWRTTVLERFGGAAGCTHVTTLLLGLSEVITLVYFQRMNETAAYGPRNRASGAWIAGSLADGAPLVDACHGLAADGTVVRQARRRLGESPERVEISAEIDDSDTRTQNQRNC